MHWMSGGRRQRAGPVLLILALGMCHARAQRYSFKTYGIDSGLRNLATNCLAQDADGYIWVGTQSGLFRYDGNAFRRMGDLETLGSLDIQALAAAPDGSVWIGARYGVVRYYRGQFRSVGLSRKIEISGNSSLAVSSAGEVYVSSAAGLVRLSLDRTGVWREQWIRNEPSTGVQIQEDGSVWFGCGSDVCQQDARGTVERVGRRYGLPADQWGSFLVQPNGDTWFRSIERFYVRRHGSVRAAAVIRTPYYSNVAPARMVGLPDGRVAVPTDQGLLIADASRQELVSAAQGLSGDSVGAVLVDREKSVWLGIRGSGVSRWLGWRQWESWSKTSGLLHDTIWAIARDDAGGLWVGSSAGVSLLAKGASRWRHITGRDGLPGARGRAIAVDSKGRVWAGTSPGRLIQFDTSGRLIRTYGPESGLDEPLIQGILEDGEGKLWVSTSHGLFRSIAPSSNMRFSRVRIPEADDRGVYYQARRDGLDRLWIPGSNGLILYDHGRWRRFGVQDGLRADSVFAVAAGTTFCWVAYAEPQGLSKLTFQGDRFVVDHFDRKNGLRSDKVYSIANDGRGWLYAGTDAGLDVLRDGEWSHYGRDSGLIWEDCDTNGMFPDEDGSVWVGTSGGLAHFLDPASTPERHPIDTILTGIRLGDRSRDIPGEYSVPYREAALQAEFSTLSFQNEDRVRFRYRLNGLDEEWRMTSQRRVEYPRIPPGRYTFEVEAKARFDDQVASRAGFTFVVRPPWWSTWWAMAGGALLLAAAIAAVWKVRLRLVMTRQRGLEAAIAVRTRELQHEVKAKDEARAKLVEAQQRLMELSRRSGMAEIATGVLHNVGNVLNSVNVSANLVADKVRESRIDKLAALAGLLQDHSSNLPEFLNHDPRGQRVVPYLAKLSTHLQDDRQTMSRELAQLTGHVGHIKEIVATQQTYAKVSGMIETVSLADLVEDALHIVQTGFERHHICIRREYHPAPPVPVDKHSVFQILLNLLRNAERAIQDGGNPDPCVSIAIDHQGDRLRVSVSDNGVGIEPQNLTRIFSHGFTTRRDGHGFGLHSGAIAARQSGGALWAESEGPGRGATFVLELPLAPATQESEAGGPGCVSLVD